jgi:hypothetical protein
MKLALSSHHRAKAVLPDASDGVSKLELRREGVAGRAGDNCVG